MTRALNEISRDLDWRESELAALRVLLLSPISSIQRRGMLRAAWALLYAHYEGFCKNALTVYFDSVGSSGIVCNALPHSIKLFALEKRLQRMRSLKSDELFVAVQEFEIKCLNTRPEFSEIDTKSNLWPSTLESLLDFADLNSTKVREHEVKLKTLVARRNDIAHGKNGVIEDVSYYRSYEEAVYDVLYDLAFQVDERLQLPPFST